MARLLIVADVVGLSLLLADVHEVVVGSGDLDGLAVDEAGRVDALVVGPRDPMRVLTALETLRKEGVTLPVLVVAGYQPSWARMTTVPYEGVLVMQPPITQEPLLEAVAELLPDDPASRRRRPQPPDEFAALPEPDTLSLPRPMLPPTVPGWEEDTVPFAVPRLDHGADAPAGDSPAEPPGRPEPAGRAEPPGPAPRNRSPLPCRSSPPHRPIPPYRPSPRCRPNRVRLPSRMTVGRRAPVARTARGRAGALAAGSACSAATGRRPADRPWNDGSAR